MTFSHSVFRLFCTFIQLVATLRWLTSRHGSLTKMTKIRSLSKTPNTADHKTIKPIRLAAHLLLFKSISVPFLFFFFF